MNKDYNSQALKLPQNQELIIKSFYKVNTKYGSSFIIVDISNQKYWSNLFSLFTTEFYENLMTYFMKHDIKEFNPRNILMTEAKQDLIEASRTPLDNWICEHYDELILGIPCSDALTSKPTEMKDKNFQLQIKDKCNRKQITIDRKRVWCYVLKEECKSIDLQKIVEYDDADFLDSEVSNDKTN